LIEKEETMSKVPLRPFAIVCVVVCALVVGCKSAPAGVPAAVASNCAGSGQGNKDHDAPVVCVDDGATLSVNPESIRTWDVLSNNPKAPPVIQWITKSGGSDLNIRMKDPGCVGVVNCNGHGHCQAKVLAGLGGGASPGTVLKQCRYTVIVGSRILDPDAVIVRCCSDQ
jgi:hypothetical protein